MLSFIYSVFMTIILFFNVSAQAAVVIAFMTKKCGEPPHYTNATVTAGSFSRDSTRTVNCNSGYVGLNSTITCQAAGWQGADPTCAEVCPTGYVYVLKNTNYTTADFCVAKYIASNSSQKGVSVSGAIPWALITQTAAITACQANGTKYDLISNAEWQTVAQDIELVAANWGGGTVGNPLGLSRGHSDGIPNNTILSSSDDNQGCINTGETCSSTTWNSQRRTFTLSNGNVIWDFAGSVWEWLKDINNTAYPPNDYISQITGIAKTTFGPSGNYTALSSTPYGGLGIGYLNGSVGAIFRGGPWFYGIDAGVFSLSLSYATSFSSQNIGFRCVWHP